MTTLLVLTAGQTDVQLIVDGVRRELFRDRCGELHDELAKREFTIIDAPAKKGSPLDALPEGKLIVCTPKLDAALREVLPSAALVLETRRDSSAALGDPRLAGAVLEARLNAKGVGTIYRFAYLQGAERLEDRDEPRDAVIRREVVQRVEGAVRDTVEAAKPTRIVVAATGGFPVVTNLVEEIVRLHAFVPVEALEIADGARARPVEPDRAVVRTSIPEPVVSFQARRRALDLLERGNLLGAWAVAEPLHNDQVEQQWTRVIEWLACFASSLPIPGGCDLPVVSHRCMAVCAAVRVELALRAGDIPKAVHGTVAFFEAALWDGLNERVERSADPERRRYFRIKSGDAPCGDKLLRQGDGSDEDRNRPFELKDTIDGVAWYRIYDGDGGPAARLGKRFLKREGLVTFDKALGSAIRALRNDVAHNEPTPELMGDARRQMQAASLWSTRDTFLSEQPAQAVLMELGESEPGKLLEQLLAEVRRRLVEPTAAWPAP
jgi:hypothetical protein